MPNYTAPLEDMMFLFDKLRNNKNYNEIEKYKEVNSELVKNILEEAAKINQNLILPLAKTGEENPTVLEKKTSVYNSPYYHINLGIPPQPKYFFDSHDLPYIDFKIS